MNISINNKLILGAVVMLGLAAAWFVWSATRQSGPGDGFVSGNGRIEATEIDIATKLGGRVADILVQEGEFIQAGRVLVQMDTSVLRAQLDEAMARLQQAISTVTSAEAQVGVRASEVLAIKAVVAQRESELENAKRREVRTQNLAGKGFLSMQKLDDDKAATRGAVAALAAARAQVKAAEGGLHAAKAQVGGARSAVAASKATIERIKADIADSQLKALRDGRIQYRIVEPGEVIGAGGKVLNMVDLSDVYMTFFLPETVVGKVALDSEARILLDALPGYVIPARVSFVASVAQFTPKTVETALERQKLMFRVKVRIDPELLKKHEKQVKTGLPGVAWLKLDSQAEWPKELTLRVSE